MVYESACFFINFLLIYIYYVHGDVRSCNITWPAASARWGQHIQHCLTQCLWPHTREYNGHYCALRVCAIFGGEWKSVQKIVINSLLAMYKFWLRTSFIDTKPVYDKSYRKRRVYLYFVLFMYLPFYLQCNLITYTCTHTHTYESIVVVRHSAQPATIICI